MRFQHPDTRAERVVEAITPRLDPEKYPNDGQIKKENDVRHLASGKCDGDDGGGAGYRPVGRDVEPLTPDHDPTHFAAIKVRHGVDISRIVNAALEGDRPLLVLSICRVFSCHGPLLNRITG